MVKIQYLYTSANMIVLEFLLYTMFFLFCFQLDIAFDGADEVDNDLNLIKGGGLDFRFIISTVILLIMQVLKI